MVTRGDVELVSDGEAPDFAADARRETLPPQVPHTPCVPPDQSINQSISPDPLTIHPSVNQFTDECVCALTCSPSWAGSPCSRPPASERCSPPVGVSPSSASSYAEPPSALRTEERRDGENKQTQHHCKSNRKQTRETRSARLPVSLLFLYACRVVSDAAPWWTVNS